MAKSKLNHPQPGRLKLVDVERGQTIDRNHVDVARQASYEIGALLNVLRAAAFAQDDELDMIARGITARAGQLNDVIMSILSGSADPDDIENVLPAALA